jgi:cell division protein FtsW (lipid II flippase)
LMESGQIKEYSKKYVVWILTFFLLWIVACVWCIRKRIWRTIPIVVFWIILLLILLKTFQRAIKERYISHLVYVPMVISVRGIWYIYMVY